METFSPHQDDKRAALVKSCIMKHSTVDDHKRAQNYSAFNFDLTKQLAITAAFRDGRCYAFSTIFGRYCYGPNAVRILNRYFISTDARAYSSKSDVSWLSHAMVQQQIQYLERFHPLITYCFISMEAPKKRWIKHWAEATRLATNYSFSFPEDQVYLVCPEPQAKSCWQHISYYKLNQRSSEEFYLLKNSLSFKFWRDHFHKKNKSMY